MNKPWYRAASNDWVVTIAGKQVPIGKDPRFLKNPPNETPREPPPEIAAKYFTMMRKRGEPEERLFIDVTAKYLDHLDTSPDNRKAARLHLKWFGEFVPESATKPIGRMRTGEIRKHFLTEYLATKPGWKPNTRRYAITRILAALNFCAREQFILANPLKGYPRPRVERRKHVITDEQFEGLVAAASPEFGDLLVVLRETGCRPGEAYEARIEHSDLARGVMLVKNKIKAITDEPLRPIFLTEKARDRLRQRIGCRESGTIFFNAAGTPWTRHTMQQHMRRLRDRLGMPKWVTAYTIRHLWFSHAINEGNVNPALVALQGGHTDLKQMMKTYLHSDTGAMLRAMEQAMKKPANDNQPPPQQATGS